MENSSHVVTVSVHLRENVEIVAEVIDSPDAGRYVTIDVQDPHSATNRITLFVRDPEQLRRLANTAAMAYHRWTVAETRQREAVQA